MTPFLSSKIPPMEGQRCKQIGVYSNNFLKEYVIFHEIYYLSLALPIAASYVMSKIPP